ARRHQRGRRLVGAAVRAGGGAGGVAAVRAHRRCHRAVRRRRVGGGAPRADRVDARRGVRGPRVTEWLLAPAPAARLAVLRILVGAYAVAWLLVRLPAHVNRPDVGWDPVGVLASLGSPPRAAAAALAVVSPAVGVAFVAG